jgi:hypothetical protein
MAEQSSVTAEAVASGTPAPVETSATTGGTPSPKAAEAVGVGGLQRGTPEERIAYLEAQQKELIAQRDAAKQRFLDSEEGKVLAAKAAKADALETERLAAEQKALEEQGRWKEIAERKDGELKAKDAAIEAERALRVAERRQSNDRAARSAVDTLLRNVRVYAGMGDLLKPVIDKALADGVVKVDESGSVAGAADLVKRMVEAYPRAFDSGAAATLAQLQKSAGGPGAVTAPLDKRLTEQATRAVALAGPGSLARPVLTPEDMQRLGWRSHLQGKE